MTPTHDEEPLFLREFFSLPLDKQRQFPRALRFMVEDLRNKLQFRPMLRVKGVQGHAGVFEMTWDMPDGRATFAYGAERTPGDPHIIWRRIGGQEIFKQP